MLKDTSIYLFESNNLRKIHKYIYIYESKANIEATNIQTWQRCRARRGVLIELISCRRTW